MFQETSKPKNFRAELELGVKVVAIYEGQGASGTLVIFFFSSVYLLCKSIQVVKVCTWGAWVA